MSYENRGAASGRSILVNGGWLFFDKVARLFLSLAVGVWIARYLGPERYGELSYVTSYAAFFQALITLGMDGIVVRDIAQKPERAGSLLGTVLFLRFVVGIVCFFVAPLLIVMSVGFEDRSWQFVLIYGFSFLVQSVDTVDLWFQSQGMNKRTVMAKLSAYVLSTLLKSFLVLYKADLFWFVVVLTFEVYISAVGLCFFYIKNPAGQRLCFDVKEAKRIIVESFPFLMSGLSIVFFMRIDQVFIRNMIDNYSLGIYAVGVQFSNMWTFLPMIMLSAVAPYLAKKKLGSDKSYNFYFLLTLKLFFWTSIVLCAAILAVSFFLIKLLYGVGYSGAENILRVHAFSNVFIFMGVAQSIWFLNEGMGGVSLCKTAIGAVLSVLMNYMFIPIWGVVVVPLIYVFVQLVTGFLLNYFFAKNVFYLQLKSMRLTASDFHYIKSKVFL